MMLSTSTYWQSTRNIHKSEGSSTNTYLFVEDDDAENEREIEEEANAQADYKLSKRADNHLVFALEASLSDR